MKYLIYEGEIEMKSFSIILILAVLVLTILFSGNIIDASGRVEVIREENFKLENRGFFSLTNVAGNIEINSWEKEEVRMVATKSISSWGTNDPNELLTKIKIEITSQPKNLKIYTRYPITLSWVKNARVDYQLWIPETARVKLESVSGKIQIENHLNQTYAKTVSGNIKLSNITGNLEVKTVSGKISAYQIKGEIKANSVSGNLLFRDSEGYFSSLNTTSGDIEAELAVIDEKASGMSFNSVSGDINLYLPDNTSFDLNIKTVSGKINTKFKVLIESAKRNQLIGEVGTGGLDIKLRTISGNIYLGKS